jgi:hypothetical protein
MACGTNMPLRFPPLTTFVNKSPDTLKTQYINNAKTAHSHLYHIVSHQHGGRANFLNGATHTY